MGQKKKVGKQRKDKFYHLAKETGYRSRAAFKLIQLNRKFEFLQKSKVLVDLCAAPGGWMQVAVEHMPVSSIIVGVDLFPIKPVGGCIGIQEDITTPRCVQLLKKELKTWKADVVLHDGAPNVGQNWLHDAYSQNSLTLSAFKLATQLLKDGGWFVTKVFRSKDYNSLLWVLQQFFKNVFSTKPAASRTESAEIFIVCKGYLAPTTIDPKFLDPKYVFEDCDVPEGKKQLQQLLQELGKKKKAEGYPTGETLLYRPIKASEFVSSPDYIDLLANTSEILIEQDWIGKSEKTTQDIIDHCKDVKVLGRKEIKALITWRKALREKLAQYNALKSEESGEAQPAPVEEVEDGDAEEDEEKHLDQVIAEMKESEMKEAKRKKKKVLKERRKVHEKTNLKMIIPGDVGPTDTSEDFLFSLKTIKSHEDVDNLTDRAAMPVEQEEKELTFEEELQQHIQKQKAKRVSFNKEKEVLDSSGRYYRKVDEPDENPAPDDSDEDDDDEDPNLENGLGMEQDSDQEDENDDVSGDDDEAEEDFDMEELAPIASHPLITDLDPADKSTKRLRKAQMWFDKPMFEGLDDDSDEDAEVDRMAESYTKKGAQILGYQPSKEKKGKNEINGEISDSKLKAAAKKRKKTDEDAEKKGLEVVSSKKKKMKLDIQGMALGSLLVQSQKKKRDLLDEGWNKYAFNDMGLPEWFVKDENKHMKKPLPVPQELVEEYRTNLMEINARPIKKVAEAKARKKKRTIRKLEKAKKKAESILDNSEITEQEKASQIKQVYKKATKSKKKEVTYVVSKKSATKRGMKRPPGVKGAYKVVDPRMKKDMRKMKSQEKQKGKKGGKGKGKSGGGRSGGGRGGRGKR